MKFYVCIKQVPDVNAPIQIKDGKLSQDVDRMILNAYDASAVEEALVLTEKHGGEVEVVLIGGQKAGETIRKALAMGAHTASHIVLENTENFDSWSFAQILHAFFKDKTFDVLSLGKQAQDSDSGLTGSMLASLLGLPYTTNAVGLTIEESSLIVKRQGDTGQEMIALPTPCVVTCSNDMNNPRIPNLKGIMASKRKPVQSLSLSDLGISNEQIAPKTNITAFEEKPERAAGKKFQGEPEEMAAQVAGLLQSESAVL